MIASHVMWEKSTFCLLYGAMRAAQRHETIAAEICCRWGNRRSVQGVKPDIVELLQKTSLICPPNTSPTNWFCRKIKVKRRSGDSDTARRHAVQLRRAPVACCGRANIDKCPVRWFSTCLKRRRNMFFVGVCMRYPYHSAPVLMCPSV